MIGTYEDFVLTLSLQNNSTVFIDKTQKERKDLFSSWVWEYLIYSTRASEEINEVSAFFVISIKQIMM